MNNGVKYWDTITSGWDISEVIETNDQLYNIETLLLLVETSDRENEVCLHSYI